MEVEGEKIADQFMSSVDMLRDLNAAKRVNLRRSPKVGVPVFFFTVMPD